jgi:polyisoprenoid-binding protein YceI
MMKKHFLSVAVFGVAAAVAARADVYDVDPAHTRLGFAARHMMVSTVRGEFKTFSGTVEYDGKDVATLKATAKIEAKSIDTGNADRDKHLRSADFFDVEKNPDVAFESTKVEKKGEQALLSGKLTIRGHSKDIAIPVSISGPVVDPWGNTRIGFEGATTVNRKDFGLNWSKMLDQGGAVVSDEVKIEITVEAIKKK